MGQTPSQQADGAKSFEQTLQQSFDIKKEVTHTMDFADMFIKYFIEMIKKIIEYTQKFIFGAFQYSKLVGVLFFFILTGILLFSKNIYGALLTLAYFFMIYMTIFVMLFFIFLAIAIFKMIWAEVVFWINLGKELNGDEPPKMNLKKIWQIIKHVFIILFICVLLFLLGWLSYVVKFFNVACSVLFSTVNEIHLPSMSSGEPDGKLGALGAEPGAPKKAQETFGSILRKILDKCS